MPIPSDILRHVQRSIEPHAMRMLNMIARGVVALVDDSKRMQMVQMVRGDLAGGAGDPAEHFEPFGFTSVSLPGDASGKPMAATMHVAGDPGHPIVIAVADRRYRPTGSDPGTVTVYNHTGAKIILTKDGDIEVQPAPGRQVFVRGPGGTADRLVTKGEYDGHTHGPGSFATPSAGGGGGPVSGTSGGAAAVAGTQRLQAE